MILRKFHLPQILLLSFHLLTITSAENSQTYDENEWIPITPSNSAVKTKKAEGRVLNLEAPSRNYFANTDYVAKRPPPQQYLQETSFQKGGNVRQPRPEQPYKFEPVLPLQPPQYQFAQQPVQPQYIQAVPYVQTLQQVQQVPSQEQPISQQLLAPPQSTQNYYDANKDQQYQRPLNNTYLQAQNLAALNQELIGAIQNQNINPHVKSEQPVTTKPKEEKESIQLLYVPLESLQSSNPITQQPPRVVKPTQRREKQLPRNHHKLNQLTNIQDDFVRQALAAHKLQQQLKLEQPVLLEQPTTTTTERPKKRKPNQPPLAVYMEKEGAADVKDVLEVLKHAKSISVQDNVGPDSPKVFVGPSNIEPEGYAKFPLPYLSAVQGNRIERKVENLPFFVAPLSYKTPEGYSKIPLPSPHVGSVVVSTKNQQKQIEQRQPQAVQNQIVPDFDVKQPFSNLRSQTKPTPYLVNPNGQQASSTNLFGYGNEFIGGFPNNPQQNYEVSSSKGFTDDYEERPKEVYERPKEDYERPNYEEIPNYQLGVRNNPDYYETTPSYKSTTETTNVRSSFSPPDYDSNDREVPNQNSKDVIRNYDIPSVPVESKTNFAPNQENQFPSSVGPTSYLTPESPANVYNLNDAPIRQPATTEALPVRQNLFKPVQNSETPEYNIRGNNVQNPYRQINQYEIEQINNQFREETTEPIRTTTPSVVSTRRYQDVPAPTARGRSRSRHRGRTTTTSTTPNAIPEENYTVLEEFAIQPKSSTVKYTTEVETIPAKVYKLEPEPPAPVFVQSQAPLKPQNLNQEILDQQVLRGEAPSSRLNVGSNQQLPYSHTPSRPNINFNDQLTYSNSPSRPVDFNHELLQTTPSPKPISDFNQEVLRNNLPSRVASETERPLSDTQDPRLTPLVYNRGQEQQEEAIAPVNPYLPGLINNLQNQAVRPLLVPNLLVPTTERLTTIPQQPVTEEIVRISTTTTEIPPIETTTQRRSRGRQRAHSSRSSTTAAPRRNSNRRRPNYTRPTTERSYTRTTTEATEYEPTRRVSSHRQRFRTRGRPVQKEQTSTERIVQTTENTFRQPPLEGGFQAASGDPESYMQFDHVVQNQQVITVKPEETPMKEYHQVYSLPPQNPSTDRTLEEYTTTSKPTLDVRITHSLSDRSQKPVEVTTSRDEPRFIRVNNNNIQFGGVLYNKNEEVTSRAPTRARGRTRSRARLSSTTPRTVTTTTTKPPQQQDEEEEEFYGFIRKPNFNQASPLIQTTTQQPAPVYSATYQQPPRTVIQLNEDADQAQIYVPNNAPGSVQFVGQLRPKYTTTEAQEYSTEAPKIRPRARIRVPNRKVTSQQQSYNEVKPQRLDDQVTRRSSIVRSRGRGKSHYKPPGDLKEKDDHDVEGGNYPEAYLKQRQLTTEKPASFQITIDPSEDGDEDQEPHSSLYSPQIIRNTETQWVEASILPNDLELEDKQMIVTSSEEQTTVPLEPTEYEQVVTDIVQEELPTNPVEELTTKLEEEISTTPVEEILTTTETVETTTTYKPRKLGRRRGVWKLVKHRPVDSFETAESQNYYSVLNAFDTIGKVGRKSTFTDSTTTTTTTSTTTAPPTKRRHVTTTTENSIFEALYSMLGFASKASQLPQSKTKVEIQKEITTTTVPPTFPEEITEGTTQEISQKDENNNYETTIIPETTAPITTTTTETSVKNYDVEPWDVREVKTSTSTEVSHETEICYKGKCIKSKEDKTKV